MVKFFCVLCCLPLFLCGVESDVLFKYISGSPALVGYADLAAIRGSWLENDLRELNSKLAASAGGFYDFSEDFEDFSSAAVAFYEPLHPKNQRLLLRGGLEPKDFFSMLENSSGTVLRRTAADGAPAAVFPAESVNRKLRGSFEPAAIALEPDVFFVGDLATGTGLLSGKSGSAAVPEAFSGAPDDAFLLASLTPSRFPAAAAFVRGVDMVLLSAHFTDADAVEVIGRVSCADVKTAAAMSVNLQMLAVTVIPALMPDDRALAAKLVSGLKVAADGKTVNLNWICSRELAGLVIKYCTSAPVPSEVSARIQ